MNTQRAATSKLIPINRLPRTVVRAANRPMRPMATLPSTSSGLALVGLVPIQTVPNPSTVPATVVVVPKTDLPGHANNSRAKRNLTPRQGMPGIPIERASSPLVPTQAVPATDTQCRAILSLMPNVDVRGNEHQIPGQSGIDTHVSNARHILTAGHCIFGAQTTDAR